MSDHAPGDSQVLPPPLPARRHHDLDALRAFAMLLGIGLHGMMSFIEIPVWGAQDIRQNTVVYGFLLEAIHGFRMPLFFLVSGFFTAMLWRRRGLRALVIHRLKRVGIPFAAGVFTIVPLIFVIAIFWGANIWRAAQRGDLQWIERYTEAGGDLNRRLNAENIPGDGATPLHMAVMHSQEAAARRLLELGADVNAGSHERAPDGWKANTPLMWAAFFGNEPMVRLLIEAGADVNHRDHEGHTALESVAGGLALKIGAGAGPRERIAALLRAGGAKPGSELPDVPLRSALGDSAKDQRPLWEDPTGQMIKRLPTWAQILAAAALLPLLAHLWFLWYLLWLVAGFVLVVRLARRLDWQPVSAWFIASPHRWLWLVTLTLVPQVFMVQSFGPDVSAGLVPWPPALIYYAIFFGFGALCYGRPEFEEHVGRRWGLCFLSGLAILPVGLGCMLARGQNFLPFHLALSVCAAAYVWLMCFGMIGLFRRYFRGENPRIRYLSDSSYWLYLAHLPLILALQIWVSDWPYPSFLKFTFVCAVTFGLLLLTYEYAVRYTWIGTVLNGKKVRPSKAAA
jgi:peptidoglycan/LPS O-acetylase OafA/YrhL